MAKSGQLLLNDGLAPGDLPLADKIVYTEATPANLGNAVADALAAADDPVAAAVDITARRVIIAPAGAFAGLVGAGTARLIGTITRDDTTKRSSPVTRAAGSSLTGHAAEIALAADLDAQYAAPTDKPAKSVAAIVNGVEDALARLAGLASPLVPPGEIFVLVDQSGDGTVKVYANDVAFDIAGLAGSELADIKQVPLVASSASADPFE